eukprot:scaffold33786_cov124-Isochrysis_galbana.AAC.6
MSDVHRGVFDVQFYRRDAGRHRGDAHLSIHPAVMHQGRRARHGARSWAQGGGEADHHGGSRDLQGSGCVRHRRRLDSGAVHHQGGHGLQILDLRHHRQAVRVDHVGPGGRGGRSARRHACRLREAASATEEEVKPTSGDTTACYRGLSSPQIDR